MRLRKAQTREIGRLQRLLKDEMKRLVAEVDAAPALAARLSLIESVQGIGRRTALILLIDMPELGQLSRQQAACLAGEAAQKGADRLRPEADHLCQRRPPARDTADYDRATSQWLLSLSKDAPVGAAMIVDERDHVRDRRSNSANAK